MQTIGLLVPMYEEIALIISQMETDKVITIGRTDYHKGTLFGKPCVTAMSGVGKVAAAITATVLIEHFCIDILLVTGTAGGVGNDVNMGDICIATEAVQHDMDASPIFPRFQIPVLGIDRFKTDTNLITTTQLAVSEFLKSDFENFITPSSIEKFALQQPRIHTGLLASGDKFMNNIETIEELRKNLPGLLFVEMEGAAVAQVCHEFSTPVVNIRTISDNANASAHIDFSDFLLSVAKYYTIGIIKHIISKL